MSALSDLLNDHLRDGLTINQVAVRIAKDPGHDVSRATVYACFKGEQERPKLSTLLALADAVPGVTLDDLLHAVGLPPSPGPYVPPREAALLSKRQRVALDELVRSMVEASADNVVPLSAPSGRPSPRTRGLGKVADKRKRELDDAGE